MEITIEDLNVSQSRQVNILYSYYSGEKANDLVQIIEGMRWVLKIEMRFQMGCIEI